MHSQPVHCSQHEWLLLSDTTQNMSTTTVTTKPTYLSAAIVGAISIALLGSGIALTVSTRAFLQKAVKAEGKVISYQERTSRNSEDRTTSVQFFPIVEFVEQDGSAQRFTSSSGSSTRPYGIGQSVGVLYDPAKSASAKIDDTTNVWGGPIALTAFGVLLLPIGIALLIGTKKRKAMEQQLFASGERIETDVVTVELVPTTNRREIAPYQIVTRWVDTNGREFFFRSEELPNNPQPYLQGRKIIVLTDPVDRAKYLMDTSFLPGGSKLGG